MVVDNFKVASFPAIPNEADPVPVIDPDTVLAGAVFSQGLELKSGAL